MMFEYGDHMSGWAWVWMGLGSLIFWALLITGVVLLIRQFNSHSGHRDRVDPEATLAQRYARGEIDDDEYERRLALLRGRHHDAATR